MIFIYLGAVCIIGFFMAWVIVDHYRLRDLDLAERMTGLVLGCVLRKEFRAKGKYRIDVGIWDGNCIVWWSCADLRRALKTGSGRFMSRFIIRIMFFGQFTHISEVGKARSSWYFLGHPVAEKRKQWKLEQVFKACGQCWDFRMTDSHGVSTKVLGPWMVGETCADHILMKILLLTNYSCCCELVLDLHRTELVPILEGTKKSFGKCPPVAIVVQILKDGIAFVEETAEPEVVIPKKPEKAHA